MSSYERTIRFAHIGLHTNVPDTDIVVGEFTSGLKTQIELYARQYLSHDGLLTVHAHPDRRDGWVAVRDTSGRDGDVLATFTLHLVGES